MTIFNEAILFINKTSPEITGILIIFVILLFWKIRSAYLWIFKRKKYKYINKYAGSLEKMKTMNWKDFEYLCEELFKARGWNTYCSKEKGADGGIDIYINRKGEKGFVQCKRYKNTSVGVRVARELYGLMAESNVDCGYIITTSYFTKEAYKFVKGKRISLIDGKQIEKISDKILKTKKRKQQNGKK